MDLQAREFAGTVVRIENSFIPVRGVGAKTEQALWTNGITHWNEFDGSVVGPTIADRIQTFIDTARTRLAEANAGYFGTVFPNREHWRLVENFREDMCFLDIETTGLDRYHDDITLIGLRQGGEDRTLIAGQNFSRSTLQRELADASLIVTFNGARFDLPFIQHEFDITITQPHIDLMHTARRLGLTGGLKQLEHDLGIDRTYNDIRGRDAVRLWREYKRGDTAALEKLTTYNRDDVANLEAVLDHVVARLHSETIGTYR